VIAPGPHDAFGSVMATVNTRSPVATPGESAALRFRRAFQHGQGAEDT